MLNPDGDILQLGRIGEREVEVPERLVTVPRHEVEAIALIQAYQPENRSNRIDLRLREGTDVDHGKQIAQSDGAAKTGVVLRLGTIVLGADDVGRAVAFWADAFGYEVVAFPDADDQFTILIPPDRVGTRIAVHRSATAAQEQPRVHIDLVVDSSTEQASEIDRLVALGATRVAWGYPSDPDFVVLADTEGNRFCVVDASHG